MSEEKHRLEEMFSRLMQTMDVSDEVLHETKEVEEEEQKCLRQCGNP